MLGCSHCCASSFEHTWHPPGNHRQLHEEITEWTAAVDRPCHRCRLQLVVAGDPQSSQSIADCRMRWLQGRRSSDTVRTTTSKPRDWGKIRCEAASCCCRYTPRQIWGTSRRVERRKRSRRRGYEHGTKTQNFDSKQFYSDGISAWRTHLAAWPLRFRTMYARQFVHEALVYVVMPRRKLYSHVECDCEIVSASCVGQATAELGVERLQ